MKEYIIDAKNKPMGKVASEAAVVLQGKNEPSYNPRKEGAEKVRIINPDKIMITGKKRTQKVYYRHSGRAGNLRKRTLQEELEHNPAEVIRRAVKNMLPKNRLQNKRLKRLNIET